jgi:hypothetical protein
MKAKTAVPNGNMDAACLAAVGILLLAAAGAARPAAADADVLATIDGVPAVTAAEVINYLEKREEGAKAGAFTSQDVADAVDELVAAKVLVLEAEAAGYGDLEYVTSEVGQFRHKALQELMLRTLERETPVTEGDLKAFFEKGRKWRKYSVIMCKNREEAEAARRELAQGKPWDEVFAAYAINEDKTAAGAWPTPMLYDGREASRAAFATPEGGFSPPARANDGIRWHVYRVDKIVHGRTDTFAKARGDLLINVSKIAASEKAEELTARLRQSVPVSRNAEMWRELTGGPFAAFEAKWGLPTSVVSTAGGVPVRGYDLVFLVYDFLSLDAAGLDAYRARDPDDFAYVMDRLLAKLEGEALLEYEAARRGLDKDNAYVRTCENWRADLITDFFISREFTAKLPPLTEEYLQRYYDDHPEQFIIPEVLECYIVALRDRERVQAFYDRVIDGESIISVGETYNRQRGRELMDAYEAPPSRPPEKEDFVRAITVYRVPNPKEPESPLAAELRGRVFARAEVGTLSDLFQLADGRWAFYQVTYYRPAGKEELSDEGVKTKCYKLAWADYVSGDDVNRRAREWLATLRAKHAVAFAETLYGDAAASANNRP